MLAAMLFALLTPASSQADPKESAQTLVRKLGSPDVEERSRAVRQLKELGDAAVPALTAATRDPDTEVAARAKYLLRYFEGDRLLGERIKKAFPTLHERFSLGSNRVWIECLSAIQRWGWRGPALQTEDYSTLVREALKEPLSDEGRVTVLYIVGRERLTEFGDVVISGLKDPNVRVRQSAVDLPHSLDLEAAIPALIPLLDDPEVRERAAESLIALGCAEAALARRGDLKSPDQGRQMLAVRMLGRLQCKECAPEIESLLAEFSGARDAVAYLGVTTAIPRLRTLLSVEESQGDVAQALARLEAVEAFDDIAGIIQAGRSSRIKNLLWPLMHLDPTRAATMIGPLLKSGDESVRRYAIKALDFYGAVEWRTEIGKLVGDPQVGDSALIALSALDRRQSIPDLARWSRSTDLDERVAGGIALARVGRGKDLAELARLLKDPEDRVRIAVLQALPNGVASEVLDEVKPLLGDENDTIRDLAAAVLCVKGRREGVGVLLRGKAPLGELNAIRDPETWARWSSMAAPRPRSDFKRTLVGRVAERMHVEVEWPAATTARERGWAMEREWDPDCALASALLILQRLLQNSPYDYVLLKDRVVLMRRSDAVRFWTNWSVNKDQDK